MQKIRDDCIPRYGEEHPYCAALIEAHKQCLRLEGFNVSLRGRTVLPRVGNVLYVVVRYNCNASALFTVDAASWWWWVAAWASGPRSYSASQALSDTHIRRKSTFCRRFLQV